ncbi:hypothetical protein GCM10009687_59940 [Asanoa iriomotensis]
MGWHGWVREGGRAVCPRCRKAAVAERPVQLRIVSWLLVIVVVGSVARAVAALNARSVVYLYSLDDPRTPTNVIDARSVLDYSVFAGFATAVVLAAIVLALRGPLSAARWAALGVLCTSLLGQVVYIGVDLADDARGSGLVPTWYPLTQQGIEVTLLLASAAAVLLLLHGAVRDYFEEGVVDADVAGDDLGRALEAVRRRRAAQR